MNCPSRNDEVLEHDGWNQSPNSLAGDMTTRSDLNGIANLRLRRSSFHSDPTALVDVLERGADGPDETKAHEKSLPSGQSLIIPNESSQESLAVSLNEQQTPGISSSMSFKQFLRRAGQILFKFGKFIGPGFMISVAYIDPGNYSTDVSAGAATRFHLLFIIFMSNLFAVVLQILAVRLGTVTGLNLAEMCRAHLPSWLNIILYILAEAAIIATDIAEVIGSAIALNLLIKVPLVAGCAITLVDVLIILIFYSPKGSLRGLRAFELFVAALVLGVVICFCIQLSLIKDTSVGEVFMGYLPSSTIIKGQGIYLSCGILGATVMVHSLYLGSGLCQSRLREHDITSGAFSPGSNSSTNDEKEPYIPSIAAIKSCLTYSIVELVFSLCFFALFVNSAILIVAGASLSTVAGAQDADLFGVYNLLSKTMAPIAGTIFALALLLSGTSAGIVATIAGQMVSEGAIHWTMAPWLRRLLTRSISIMPSIIIAAAIGRDGLSAALNGTQVALSVILPFTSAPLIYFTARNKYMTVHTPRRDEDDELEVNAPGIKMRNHWALTAFAVLSWIIITIMNIALLVLIGLGAA